jgi:hypothetical protein
VVLVKDAEEDVVAVPLAKMHTALYAVKFEVDSPEKIPASQSVPTTYSRT